MVRTELKIPGKKPLVHSGEIGLTLTLTKKPGKNNYETNMEFFSGSAEQLVAMIGTLFEVLDENYPNVIEQALAKFAQEKGLMVGPGLAVYSARRAKFEEGQPR